VAVITPANLSELCLQRFVVVDQVLLGSLDDQLVVDVVTRQVFVLAGEQNKLHARIEVFALLVIEAALQSTAEQFEGYRLPVAQVGHRRCPPVRGHQDAIPVWGL